MINDIQTYVMCHRSTPCSALLKWLSAWQPDWKRGSQVGFAVDLARNQTVNQFLRDDAERGKNHLLMLDADMVPIISTNAIIGSPGDFLYCSYAGHQGTHGHRNDAGAGCVRLSREAIGKMTDFCGKRVPLFKTKVNRTCDRLVRCECRTLSNRAWWAGVTPHCVGMIGHQQGGDGGVVIFPNDKNRSGFSLCWPHEIGY